MRRSLEQMVAEVRDESGIGAAIVFLAFQPKEGWATIENFSHPIWREVLLEVDQVTQATAELGAYLSMRGGAWCGDHGHEQALSHAQTKLRKIRKAMGYSYP